MQSGIPNFILSDEEKREFIIGRTGIFRNFVMAPVRERENALLIQKVNTPFPGA